MSHNSKIMENELDLDNPINVPEDAPAAPQEDLTEKLKELETKAKDLEEKNKQLFERAKKAEEKIKEFKPVETKEEPKAPSQIDPRDIVRLTKALQGFNDEEVSFIYRNAKSQNLDDIVEATKDPWVSSAIESQRQKVEQEKKVPEPGVVPGGLPKKELTVEDLMKDPDAHKRAFEKLFEPNQASGI